MNSQSAEPNAFHRLLEEHAELKGLLEEIDRALQQRCSPDWGTA
jgi:hypothetical protein